MVITVLVDITKFAGKFLLNTSLTFLAMLLLKFVITGRKHGRKQLSVQRHMLMCTRRVVIY